MAKNVLQTKKRVSHFQRTHKDLDGENELFGCKDYVSSIIQDMDSNFSNIQSSFSKKGIDSSEIPFPTLENSFLNIPILTLPSPSSSNGTSLIPAKHTARSKKFSLSKKFPLMEKSQKILKQLKHNQNIPKPRAHLAGIPRSPAKNKAKHIPPKLSTGKNKVIPKVKNKVTNSLHCTVPCNQCPVLNSKNPNVSKSFEDNITVKHSKPKKTEDKISGKGSVTNIPTSSDTSKEANSILESDSGTSDGEYERFLKKSKKGLQKKTTKKQKQDTRKSKSCTRSSKRKKLSCVDQKNIHVDEVTESSTNSKIIPCKKQKIVQDNTCFDDSNYSDCDVPDLSTRDSSYESDDDSVANSKTQQMISKIPEVKPINEAILSGANSSQSYANPYVSESNFNSGVVSSNDETQIVNSIQLNVKHTDRTEILSDANLPLSNQNLHVLESEINTGKAQGEVLTENPITSIKIERENLCSNQVIDICDSDDESESDIEIIEEVEAKPVQTLDRCSTSVLVNAPDCLKNVIGSEKHSGAENLCVDVKPSIKTINLDNKSSVNISPVVKSQNEADVDDDVVYRTDICHTKIILEQRTVLGRHCSKTQNVPSEGSFLVNPDLTVVKHENGADDDITVLDSVYPTKIDTSNFPTAKTENIKSEPSTSENVLKLRNTINSESMTEIIEWGKEIEDVISVSSAELLAWYKMELKTLDAMKKTTDNVQVSIQNIQARQFEKTLYIRNLFLKSVKNSKDTKLLAGSALLPFTEPSKDSKNLSVNTQSNFNTAPNNSFSCNPQIVQKNSANQPSIAVQDVKPDVSKLKEGILSEVTPKIESIQGDPNPRKLIPKIESDDKQTLKLLDEKCSVCGKDAVAACQRCAKVFFCSHECGKKFWIDGHVKVCGTR